MNPEDRAKETVRYYTERLRLLVLVAVAVVGGFVNLLLGEISGRRFLLAVSGAVALIVLVEAIRRENYAIWSLLKDDDHA
ncbi:MAG: hypothetical protein HYZ50_11640 [Deltaproteobacteria bacterium]|nr:hypothetical protein [Deltaproteobacteria bacterium]